MSTTDHKYAGADWVQRQVTTTTLSPLGRRVADLLGDLYGGIYHIAECVRRVDWASNVWIEINVPDGLATFDQAYLTRLVLLCHDHCLRCAVLASGRGLLKLRFHGRERSGRFWERHPSIDEAVTTFRSEFSTPDA